MSNIDICFHNLSDNDFISLITRNDTNLYLWYIGSNGFRKDGVLYYRKMLRKLLQKSNIKIISLVDLTAWASFFNSSKNITDADPNVNLINSFNSRINCIASSDFFFWLKNETNESIISLFNEITDRPELYTISEKFNDSQIKLSDIFCPISPNMLHKILHMDTSKIYSVIQYIEAFYLIYISIKKEFRNICFLLPNNEIDYYAYQNFHSDIVKFLSFLNLNDKLISILFVPFKYTSHIKSRPYNSGRDLISIIDKSLIL